MSTTEDTTTELARLRAENERLRATLAEDGKQASTGRGRSIVVWILIVLGCLAAMAAAVGIWARTTALDTDTYVDTVGQLPQDPAVSAALAPIIVDEVFADVDIQATLEQQLPPDLTFLAAPVAGGVREVSVALTEGLIASDAFRTVWEGLNRIAHQEAVAVLTGRGAIALTQEGAVVLDLTDAATAARDALEEAGFGGVLPAPREEGATVVLFEDTDLGILQLTVDLLDTAYWGLPLLTILALGGALWISRDRRRTWFRIGTGLAIAMAASLILLDLSRGAVVDGIEDPLNQAGIRAIWDRLFTNLVGLQAALLVLSLIIAATAFLLGPHRWAMAFRESVGNRTAAWRTGERVGEVQETSLGVFLARHIAGVRTAGVVAALLFMLVWPRLTVGLVLVSVIGLVIYLLLVELLRSPAPPQTLEADDAMPVTLAEEGALVVEETAKETAAPRSD